LPLIRGIGGGGGGGGGGLAVSEITRRALRFGRVARERHSLRVRFADEELG